MSVCHDTKILHHITVFKKIATPVFFIKKIHPFVGTEALYRPYGPQGE